MSKLSELVDQADKIIKEPSIDDLIIESEVRYEDKYKEAPVLLEMALDSFMNFQSMLTLGNISMIKAPSKARKTFAATLFLSVITYCKSLNNILFCRKSGYVLFFDTEQSKFHTHKVVKRISAIFGESNQNPNFFAFSLRKYQPDIRMKIIESIIHKFDNISYIVIDGIRDVIFSINDETEAITAVTKFMKISEEKQCHITGILHENKSDGKARGWIGSEFQNKSETVFKIEKNGNESNIIGEFTRNGDFPNIEFTIENRNGNFIPVITKTNEEPF